MSLDQTPSRQPDHPVAGQFTARWSPRSFTDQTLTKDEVMSLLEAARWAPSASNQQPWRLVWALSGEAEFDAIFSALAVGNQLWAGRAAVLVVVASHGTTVGPDGEKKVNGSAAFDTGSAWLSLALQAHAMGLAAHAMGGFDREKLATLVGLPDGHSLHAVVAVGYQGPADALPDALREREKPSQRKPLAEIALHGRF